ncbi:hypothetical protein XENOCAPTIV_028095 [Xenoophorus captivus]|uniref:Uncharacterized protein n=1 Tax=Xenoophorus captivus TaxID=1517983 RepID=A0ABV0RDW4_9TELE
MNVALTCSIQFSSVYLYSANSQHMSSQGTSQKCSCHPNQSEGSKQNSPSVLNQVITFHHKISRNVLCSTQNTEIFLQVYITTYAASKHHLTLNNPLPILCGCLAFLREFTTRNRPISRAVLVFTCKHYVFSSLWS